MHTIYSLFIAGVIHATNFPTKMECIEYAKANKIVEYKCEKTRGRISWQQLV